MTSDQVTAFQANSGFGPSDVSVVLVGGVFVVLNLSGEAREVTFGTGPHHGAYIDRFSGERLEVGAATALALEPWGWRVLVLDTPGE